MWVRGKGQEDEEKSLGRYVEDDWKQMLAAVKGEAERGDHDSEGYLSFKDRETEIKCLSICREKDRKDIFLHTFEENNHEVNSSVWCAGPGHYSSQKWS